MRNNYKAAGVDVEAGYEAVEKMKKHVARTQKPGALSSLGGFGGLFGLDLERFNPPVLVSGTDGVGTKLILAMAMTIYDTIGIDAVAMVVNDIIAQGAEPLFFLDYLAVGKNNPDRIADIVSGIAEGCVQAGCEIVGGETAEMPDMYSDEEFDVAGFAVGAANKEDILTPERVEDGDVLIGLLSSGLHSNGFSLVRKILFKDHDYQLTDIIPELNNQRLGDVLLTPTKIYVQAVLPLLNKHLIHGISHITGGGFSENIPRMLPENLTYHIDYSAWEVPSIFRFLGKVGEIDISELYDVFNMGIGMVLAVAPDQVDEVMTILRAQEEKPVVIGDVHVA